MKGRAGRWEVALSGFGNGNARKWDVPGELWWTFALRVDVLSWCVHVMWVLLQGEVEYEPAPTIQPSYQTADSDCSWIRHEDFDRSTRSAPDPSQCSPPHSLQPKSEHRVRERALNPTSLLWICTASATDNSTSAPKLCSAGKTHLPTTCDEDGPTDDATPPEDNIPRERRCDIIGVDPCRSPCPAGRKAKYLPVSPRMHREEPRIHELRILHGLLQLQGQTNHCLEEDAVLRNRATRRRRYWH